MPTLDKMRWEQFLPQLLFPLCAALSSCGTTPPAITADAETTAVVSRDDAADDAAIWYRSESPGDSLILGADKTFGLRAHSLDGTTVQELPVGRLNNVDIRKTDAFPGYSHLVAASNRSRDSVSLFGVEASGRLAWLEYLEIDTGLADPYGICLYSSASGLYIFVNDKDGRYQQWRVKPSGSELVRNWQVDDQPEGCAADDRHGILFYGVEVAGVYSMTAEPDTLVRPKVLATVDSSYLTADVEGMDIYPMGDGGYLVVSSQGNNSFVVFERRSPHRYLGRFRISDGDATDGVSDTDGVAVHPGPFGDRWPQGILVVQDGLNTRPSAGQNFKIVDWRKVEALLDTGSAPQQ